MSTVMESTHPNVLPSSFYLGNTPFHDSLGLSLLGDHRFSLPGSQKLVLGACVSPSWRLAREGACASLGSGILQIHHSLGPWWTHLLLRYLRVKGVHKGYLHMGQFPVEVHTYTHSDPHRHTQSTSLGCGCPVPHGSSFLPFTKFCWENVGHRKKELNGLMGSSYYANTVLSLLIFSQLFKRWQTVMFMRCIIQGKSVQIERINVFYSANKCRAAAR